MSLNNNNNKYKIKIYNKMKQMKKMRNKSCSNKIYKTVINNRKINKTINK